MIVNIADISPNRAARTAGILYLVLIAAGIFAEFFVRSSLTVPGDAAATAANIAESEGLFRAGIAADLVMIICDTALALLFFILLRPVNRSLSLLAAFFRLAQAAVLGVNLLNLLFALRLLSGSGGYLLVFSAEQLDALVLLFRTGHADGYVLGLVFFGVNCLVAGYLIYRSGFLPKILGILIIIAGIGYLTDSFAQVLLGNYADYASIFGAAVFGPAFIAELALALWLLVKGVKTHE